MDIETLFKLIERQGTLEQVSNFLRQLGLPYSGSSWKDMVNLRLRTAVEKGRLTDDQLLDLLRQTEEHGSQHIFLFTLIEGRSVSKLFSDGLPAVLSASGFPPLGHVSVVDMPDDPQIVEVREEFGEARTLVFKIVEQRSSFEKVSDQNDNGQKVVTYSEIPYRAVNIMRISEDGRAEIRLQSHSDAISYNGIAEATFKILSPIINRLDWKDDKLDKFKNSLLDISKRSSMSEVFGLRHTQLTNIEGTRLSAAAGLPGASMYDDTEVVASVDRFLEKENHAHCDRASVSVKKRGTLSRSINLVVSGEPNEFAITSKVSKSEYDYILNAVLEHNI
ncbi:hypothetical protein EYC79_05670 [Agrobacterium cavarae]|uniref:Uncharacterized protein n=1 Tax=Agrobacterium cavarae TaxID=2528239 RepID=A0ABY1YCI9_9HYPH|nr:hypothetical protein [Agrobacterium cavarae]TBN15914.1 hypothetical protein EYC79_05670 [Agrobacterium cavarae]